MNRQIDQLLSKHPLLKFSLYTDVQVGLLRERGMEIIALLDDACGQDSSCDADAMMRIYGCFWLWVLGSYEVVRTMDEARSCFAPALAERLNAFKRTVGKLRMPFAKQEYGRGRTNARPISAEASIYSIESRDFIFEVRGTSMSIRGLVTEFESLMAGIRPSDVLHDHRRSAKYTSPPPLPEPY
jgi:hypothetical protein